MRSSCISSDHAALPFRRPLLVVAHPDDEALWFSSVLSRGATVVVCFLDYGAAPQVGPARRLALSAHPLAPHCLGVREPDSLDRADWRAPRLDRVGLWLADPRARRRYRRAARRLESLLPPLLRDHDAVFTHNPWGEYGHEDHVLVHAILKRAAVRAGTELWVPLCAARKARPLARRFALDRGAERLALPSDARLARAIREVYRSHGCWTWNPRWRWPAIETFARASDLLTAGAPLAAPRQSDPWFLEPLPLGARRNDR